MNESRYISKRETVKTNVTPNINDHRKSFQNLNLQLRTKTHEDLNSLLNDGEAK